MASDGNDSERDVFSQRIKELQNSTGPEKPAALEAIASELRELIAECKSFAEQCTGSEREGVFTAQMEWYREQLDKVEAMMTVEDDRNY